MKSIFVALAAVAVLALATPAVAVSSVPVAGSITGTTVPSGLCLNTASNLDALPNRTACEAFLAQAAVDGANGSITGTVVPSGLCGNGNEQTCLDWLAARN